MHEKTVAESKSIISNMMLPIHANAAGIVHGGEIMKLMDTCCGVTAMRHAKANAVTVRVDEMIFYRSVMVGHVVMCESELVFVGRTSMDIKVTVTVEDVMGTVPAFIAQTAFFTFVALDNDGKPFAVPRLKLTTPEEKQAFLMGENRYLNHKKKMT